jgi:hypothetical protein
MLACGVAGGLGGLLLGRASSPLATLATPPSAAVATPPPAAVATPPSAAVATPPAAVATPPAATATPPPAAAPVPFDIPLQVASVAEIDARRGTAPALFRLVTDPAVLVLDFPNLHTQALMLNRVAALIEKADMPRDRIETEAALDAHIRATGDDPDHYYYGHDYRAADLARFFHLAETQAMPLNPSEAWLGRRLQQEGWLRDGATGALISIPGLSAGIDAASRTAILRHELSHAVYFTDPSYVALTHHLWADQLTDTERSAIRRFLGNDGYDTQDEDLMANEGQAYLIHTRDPRYFTPDMIGMSPARAAALRAGFIAAIPQPWLRDSALAVAPVVVPADPSADVATVSAQRDAHHKGAAHKVLP